MKTSSTGSIMLFHSLAVVCLGILLSAGVSEARSLTRKERTALDRANARIVAELAALGLHLGPKEKASPWRERFVYGGKDWSREIPLPAYSFEEMKPSEVSDPRQLWSYADSISGRRYSGLWRRDGTETTKVLLPQLELKAMTGRSLARRKSAREKAGKVKSREWTLTSNRIEGGHWIKEKKPRQSRRAVAEKKQYGGLPGEQFVLYREGQQRFCTGYLRRWRKYVHEVGGSAQADSIEATLFKDLDESARIAIQATVRKPGGSCLFRIEYIDVALMDEVMQTVARILNEEFDDLNAGEAGGAVARSSRTEVREDDQEEAGAEEDKEETPDDGYWRWFPRYVEEKAQRQQRIDEIRFELSVRAREIADYRQRWMELLRLDMELFQANDLLDSKIVGQKTAVSTKRHRERLRAQINSARKAQSRLVSEGLEQIALLERRVKEQVRHSGDRRPELSDELERLRDQKPILELQFYDAAEWYAPHQLPKLIRSMDLGRKSAPDVVKLIEAKSHLADAQRLEAQLHTPSAVARNVRLDEPLVKGAITARFKALENVREVLEKSPGHLEARAMLQEMELYWLKQIGAKLEREKRVSLAAFGAYLKNRGYDPEDRAGWWEGFKEYASVAWSSGPISLGAGLPGVDMPWVVAEDVSITQTEIAKNLVSILAIKRLRKNGVPLTEIRNITPDELAEKMVLHTAAQTRLPEKKARRMVRDIRETFAELGELQALADGKLVEFNLAMGRSTYGSIDAEQSWGEYLGDAFSPRHLISLFGPSAIVKVGGKWAFSGRMIGSEIRAAEAAGQVMRGRDALVAGLRLERLGQSLASSRRGAWLRNKLIADHEWFTQLPGWERFLRKGSAVVGSMIVLGGASHLAQESGIPGAVLLVDLVSELTGQEIFFDILARSGSPAGRLAGRVDELLEFAARKQDDVARYGRSLDELDSIAAKVRANKGKVTKETRRQLSGVCRAGRDEPPGALPAILAQEVDRVRSVHSMRSSGSALRLLLGASSGSLIPGCPAAAALQDGIPGTVEESLGKVLKDVLKALRDGDAAEAQRALRAARELNAAADDELRKLITKAQRARRALATGNARSAEVVTEQLSRIKQTPAAPFAHPDYYTGPAGKKLLEADELLRRGEFDEALARYRAAKELQDAERLSLGRKFTREQEEQLKLMEERIALVLNTKKTLGAIHRTRRRGTRVAAKKAFSGKEIESVLAAYRAGKRKKLKGSLNPVFEVLDAQGNEFIVKRVADAAEATTEVAAALLANKVGLNAPRAHAAKLGRGQAAEYVVVSRSIREGADGMALKLSDATEPVAVALKKDYARQRVFRTWLGDSDGHLGNQLFAADGRLWQIDFGMSNLKSNRALRQIGEPFSFTTESDFLTAVVGVPYGKKAMPRVAPEEQALLDHFGPRFFDRVEAERPYRWMSRMDGMVDYHDMRETLEAILRLTKERDGDVLKAILKQSGHPDPADAFRVLKERAAELESVLEKRFGNPIQTGALSPPAFSNPLRLLNPSVDWMRMAA